MLSLNARLLIAASIVLVGFFGATGYALDRAFRQSALVAVQDRLQAQVYMLLGAAVWDVEGGLSLPAVLPEARLSTPGSGLYAGVVNSDDEPIWRSLSLLGMEPVIPDSSPPPGEFRFVEQAMATAPAWLNLAFTVSWEIGPDRYQGYTFWVAETREILDSQVEGFRRSLGTWLVGAAVLMLAVQGLILRWSLLPLRRVARELSEIESGRQDELTGPYPTELQPLTNNLNNLIRHARSHLERYRNSLGDLAHSLKTPLAVLQTAVDNRLSGSELQTTLEEHLGRMRQTVDYQLQRAAASGRVALAAPLPITPVARKVMNSLAKVYADKALDIQLTMDGEPLFPGDQGDLMEILGNLGDNACKWANSRVTVRARMDNGRLTLEVEDDGPGIAPALRRTLLQRGLRGDTQVEGQGIGLAVVRELVEELYRGELQILGERGTLMRVLLRA